MGKKVNYEINKSHKLLQRLIERYGKVRVVFSKVRIDFDANRHSIGEEDRRRILSAKGMSKVSYKRSNGKWGSYSESCFVSGRNVKSLPDLMSRMSKHDMTMLIPTEVHYGLFYLKKIKLHPNK